MDLWEFLRQSVKYDGRGHCEEWTEFSLAILLGSENVRQFSAWQHKPLTHYFLRSVVPDSSSIAVPSPHVIDTVQKFAGRSWLEDITDRIPLVLRGNVRGKPGEICILDGTADQHNLVTDYSGDELRGGFYGAETLVPSRQLKDLYGESSLFKLFNLGSYHH
jgi:hypothetical protein